MPDQEKRMNNNSGEQTNDFLRRSSITYLECAISLMLSHMSREEVASILEQESKIVRELG